jgi:hypothetical protein
MKRFLTAAAAIAMLATSAISTPAKAFDPVAGGGLALNLPTCAWACTAGLFGYMVYATATGQNIGASPSQKAEATEASRITSGYQTVPAYTAQAAGRIWAHDPRLLTEFAFAAVPQTENLAAAK